MSPKHSRRWYFDESVWETLSRDLVAVWEKMRQVLWPKYLLGGMMQVVAIARGVSSVARAGFNVASQRGRVGGIAQGVISLGNYLTSSIGGEDRRATQNTIDESVWETLSRDLVAVWPRMLPPNPDTPPCSASAVPLPPRCIIPPSKYFGQSMPTWSCRVA
jgi:hypothetical protein